MRPLDVCIGWIGSLGVHWGDRTLARREELKISRRTSGVPNDRTIPGHLLEVGAKLKMRWDHEFCKGASLAELMIPSRFQFSRYHMTTIAWFQMLRSLLGIHFLDEERREERATHMRHPPGGGPESSGYAERRWPPPGGCQLIVGRVLPTFTNVGRDLA